MSISSGERLSFPGLSLSEKSSLPITNLEHNFNLKSSFQEKMFSLP